MSDDNTLRANIFGFQLDKVASLAGSKDQFAFWQICQTLAAMADSHSPEMLKECKQIVEQAITNGIPFVGLTEESEPHVVAATALAGYDQDLTATDAEAWQMSVFWAFLDQFADELDAQAYRLFTYFCEGRPLFGKIINTDRQYYGYLTHDELKLLKQELSELEEYIADWEEKGIIDFLHDLIGWLDSALSSNQDLWFYAQ